MSDNDFAGAIPPALGELSSLKALDLSLNDFTGGVAALGQLTALERLLLQDNELAGPLFNASAPSNASSLGNLTNLQVLDLHDNHLTGAVPESFGRLSSLRSIRLSFNDLTSWEPPSFCNLLDENGVTCDMSYIGFACPLPACASLCNANCTLPSHAEAFLAV